ncbi:MAG TPA: phosphate ABC transporter substrate-binding protein PstS [Candidatus Sulfotelmatobacter sp.]
MLSLACESKPNSEYTITASADAPTSVLGASGSTFIAPLMDKWAAAYHQTHPKVEINYRPIGSGGGIEEMKQGYLSFGASDAPLSDDQIKDLRRPIIQVPASAGPVCIVYNLSSLSVPLKLSAKSLSDIYLGNVINWEDPEIAKDNPGVKLPKGAIIVVHRSDGSGTTNIFTSYLSKVNHYWQWRVGQGLSVSWPIGLGTEGSKALLAMVRQTPGTIGYIELSYAKHDGAPVASIQNQAGHFVQPSSASAAAAIAASSDALAKDVRTPIVDPPTAAADAYPISGLTFILIPKDRTDVAQQETVKDFIAFALSSGQDSAEELSYAKLPETVKKQGQALLNQLTANGQPLK